LIGELLGVALYPLILGLIGGFLIGFLLRRLGRIIAAIVAIGVFILNTLPILRLIGIQPDIEWLRRLGGLLPTPPSEALESFKSYLPLISSIPFILGLILGLIIGFKAD